MNVTRTLYLLDIENMCGTGRLEPGLVASRFSQLEEAVAPGPADQMIVGYNPLNRAAVAFGIRRSHGHVERSGPDGADLALEEVMSSPHARRFDHIVLASGDHMFAPVVARLAVARDRHDRHRRSRLSGTRASTCLHRRPADAGVEPRPRRRRMTASRPQPRTVLPEDQADSRRAAHGNRQMHRH